MNELNHNERISEKERIESIVKKQKEVHYKFVDDLRPKKGHVLFEIDLITGSIEVAKFIENKTITWAEALKIFQGTFHDKTAKKADCVYISALNKKNAIDRFIKGKGSARNPEATMKLMRFV